jgi:hypothetical protein
MNGGEAMIRAAMANGIDTVLVSLPFSLTTTQSKTSEGIR